MNRKIALFSNFVVFCFFFIAPNAQAAEIRGKVLDIKTGEALSKVRLSVVELGSVTITATDGTFSIAQIAPGRYTLNVDAVGFWRQQVRVEITEALEVKEYIISLTAEGQRRTERIDVHADVFLLGAEPAEVAQQNLTANEVKEASTVLASDPFRALQALPGVSASANNDFYAQFTVLGEAYQRLAVYLDDVYVLEPFHGIPGDVEGASVSLFSPDTLESLTLTPTAFSERYGDGTGGALDIRTREGSRTPAAARISVGLAESHGTAEGALGPQKRGSWLFSVRRSYLGWLTHRSVDDPSIAVNFYDLASRVVYDVSPRQSFDFYALHGEANLDRSSIRDQLGPNQLMTGHNVFSLARVGWRNSITPQLLWSARAAFIRHPYDESNSQDNVLRGGYHGEWAGGTAAVWSWKRSQVLEAGWSLRRLRSNSQLSRYDPDGQHAYSLFLDGTGLQQGLYAQQSTSLLHDRLHLMAGMRLDRHSAVAEQPILPQASLSLRLGRATTVQFGFGRYVEFSNITPLGQFHVARATAPAPSLTIGPMFGRSTHYLVGVEQRLGEHSRLQVEAYDHQTTVPVGVRNVYTDGSVGPLRRLHTDFDDARDYSRGVQVTLQRRASNRLAGWLSYTLGYARAKGPILSYYTMQDQRHTANAFASYRLRPTINIGGKWLYGSGYPLGTSLRRIAPDLFVSTEDTALTRLGPYIRVDVRIDKAFPFSSRKLTLYGEAINVTNHHNYRYTGYSFVDPLTGLAYLRTERTAGFTPTAGIAIEF